MNSLTTRDVHIAEALGHHFHDMDSKMGRLNDHIFKPILVNRHNFTICASNSRSGTGTIVDQSQFTEDAALFNCLDDFITQENIDLTLLNNIHKVTNLAACEDGLACFK